MSTSLYSELTETINNQRKIIFALVYQLTSIYANSKSPKITKNWAPSHLTQAIFLDGQVLFGNQQVTSISKFGFS